jgi:molybdopterin molybdotransferase
MLTPAEAETLIFANLATFPPEDCPLGDALGRVLRAAIRADRDLPPFDRVTMDGYAMRAASLGLGVKNYRVEGIQPAGVTAQRLGEAPDACVEVMTGAVLPIGADCVVPYEDTVRDGAQISVAPPAGEAVLTGQFVHPRGSDHQAGAEIVPAGVRVTGREIAVAAAGGSATLTVSAIPKIAVVATGDELVAIDQSVGPHQIRRSNDSALRAALVTAGFARVECFHLRDNRDEIDHSLRRILADFDVVILSGGVSKGKFDHLPAALATLEVEKIFHGVAQRPGKPLWFGLSQRRTPVFALPGNPVSAYTCLYRYVLPALARASGLSARPHRLAALAAPVTFKPALAYFLPVKLSSGPRAELLATPDPANTSGDFAGLVMTDGFVELPPEPSEFPLGFVAPFFSWS